MLKKIYKYEEIKDKILKGLDTISDPIRQTLGPKGGDVLIETDTASLINTNDGVTIARNIELSDQIEGAIVDIVKTASLKTNSEAGDGTSSTVVLSNILVKEGLKLKEAGKSRVEIKKAFLDMAEKLKKNITHISQSVKTDTDLENIARISANNDSEIATHILDVVKTAGEDGMVFLEPNNSQETDITKDLGFMVKSGVMYQELVTDPARPVVTFENIPVLITDKNLYYPEEAETIMRVAIKAGYEAICIVAKNFSGEALPTFIKNHQHGNIKVVLVKDPQVTDDNNTSLDDLAQYLNGKVITDKTGSLVNNVDIEDFVIASKIYSDPQKTLFTPKEKASKQLKERIKYLKEELTKDKDNHGLKQRLSSLTNGVVTVKVGGSTQIEVKEKIYRYEDAVNATRAAMKRGYVLGGGLSLLRAFKEQEYDNDMKIVAKKFCEAIARQVIENCGKHQDTVLENITSNKSPNYGYNALTDSYGDLIKEGVIDPTLVLEMAIDNAVSIANIIVGINSYIINDLEAIKEREVKE